MVLSWAGVNRTWSIEVQKTLEISNAMPTCHTSDTYNANALICKFVKKKNFFFFFIVSRIMNGNCIYVADTSVSVH